ncbi:hypothetical protein Q4S45_07920 [Massilia sp. R2A-15]|uniref:hypothetical protein n=1 Tax=Massilia sp. R2A-15 TaxID=3064278 RepID=UPI00273319EF|nr:hypothetical protein [Massilia sp. R2A-15]WLI91034.1 hypothetical protein Q4S45_07920 [Massilia sp. R2A-15]
MFVFAVVVWRSTGLDPKSILFWFNIFTQVDWEYFISRAAVIVALFMFFAHLRKVFEKMLSQFNPTPWGANVISWALALLVLYEAYHTMTHLLQA